MKEEIEKCLDILRKGGVILYPTDTVWGIGCDATNEQAVQYIFRIKLRNESKSMIVLIDDAEQIEQYAYFPPAATELLKQARSPLTIIYPNAKNLAPSVIAADKTIAIRIIKEEFCRNLISQFGKPIVSTSANKSGEKPPRNFSEISEAIKNEVDYVVNRKMGETSSNKPSRIIKINANGTVQEIRV